MEPMKQDPRARKHRLGAQLQNDQYDESHEHQAHDSCLDPQQTVQRRRKIAPQFDPSHGQNQQFAQFHFKE